MGSCFTNVLHDANTIFVNLFNITRLHEITGAPTGSHGRMGGNPRKCSGTAYLKGKELKSEKIEKFR